MGRAAQRNQPRHEVFDQSVPSDSRVTDKYDDIVRRAQRTESLDGLTLEELSVAAGRAHGTLDANDPAQAHIQAAVERLLHQQEQEFVGGEDDSIEVRRNAPDELQHVLNDIFQPMPRSQYQPFEESLLERASQLNPSVLV